VGVVLIPNAGSERHRQVDPRAPLRDLHFTDDDLVKAESVYYDQVSLLSLLSQLGVRGSALADVR
jgi:hypothetical protein